MQKSIKRLLSVSLIVVSLFLFVACSEPTPTPTPNEITEETLQALVFNDATFEYDGTEKQIFVENPYEEQGVTVSYRNNKNVKPGTYTVSANIKYESITVTKKAKVTITKASAVLEAEVVQTIYLTDDNFAVEYNLNNDKQKIVMVNEAGAVVKVSSLTKVGVYKLELYAEENEYYLESNHVKVTFNVIKSQYAIKFDSKEITADGQEHELVIEGTLPTGYTVEYKDNKGIEDGSYYATATIKDDKGEVVEVHNAVLKIENAANEEFDKYLDEFFVAYLEEDQLSVNIFCEDPSKFGLEHYEAEWYTYETFGDDEIEHDLNLFKDMLAELEVFKDEPLNDLQESAYRTVEKFLKYYVEFYSIEDSFFSQILYVDQFGGYVADFGTYMEAYSLRSEVEVQDIVKFIESTKTAFPSYLDFVQDKTEKGYALSDYTIREMRKYLDDILNGEEEYYLTDVLCEKIDGLTFLTDDQKTSYKDQVALAIDEYFIVGVQELYDGLKEYLGKLSKEDEGYYAKYENGADMFVFELENLLGLEIDVDAYIKEVELAVQSAVDKVIDTQKVIINKYGVQSWSQLESIINKNKIFDGTPEEMVEFLKEFAKEIVPELEKNPDIKIKEMDEASAKVSNAVAYYMKSALDNTASEYITLNPVKLGDSTSNDVLSTLAHEGYPGHLFAYVYSKELGLSNIATVMTSTAHGEGWATYVSTKLFEYAIENSTSDQYKEVMEYLLANELSGHLLETRIDAGIHLQGWTVEDVATYMDDLGYSSSGASDIYNLMIEMPTQYAAYGYGKLFFNNLHNEAKKYLGVHYDEIEFNTMLLSKGWTNLGILQDTYDEYMMAKCHELGIEFK